MSIDIGTAFSGALERVRSRDGLVAMGLLGVVAFLRVVGNASTNVAPAFLSDDRTLVFVAVVYLLLVVATTVLVQVLVFRLLHNGGSAGLSGRVTHRVGLATLWLFLVNLAVGLAVLVGTVFLIVPGVFLAVSLILTLPVVAIEDVGPLQALDRGWDLATGNRVELLVLGLVHVGVGMVVGLITSVAGLFIGFAGLLIPGSGPAVTAVTTLLSGFVGALVGVPVNTYFLALLVESYDQVSDAGAAEPGTSTEATSTDRLSSIGD